MRSQTKLHARKRRTAIAPPDRRGSTIIVVIAMLSALMILGFFFFSIAAQENENAEYFKETAKNLDPVELDPDQIFDCFLEQYILGAEPTKYNSVFYGGRHSLLPTMFGTDLSPFNGEGVNTTWPEISPGVPDPTLGPSVDLDYDGTPDASDAALQINQMPGAQLIAGANADNDVDGDSTPDNGIDLVNNELRWMPEPDVDYVYPDHNFPLLTYYGFVPSQEHPTGVDLVLMPAGVRPQLMRNRVPQAQWYTDPSTQGYTLRAHQERLAVLSDGTVSNNRRFISGAHPGGIPEYFASAGFANPPVEGVWQAATPGDMQFGYDSGTGAINYNYEANPAGRVDGAGNQVNTSIYLDCDYPIQIDRNTGTQFVPMVSAEILDAEALLNLNVVGNTNRQYANAGAALNSISSTESESRSNLGYSPSEISPFYALLTNPTTENPSGYNFDEYNDYFRFAPAYSSGTPPLGALMANADIWSILHGRPKISSGQVSEVYPGRFGEAERARQAWESVSGVGSYPLPGDSLVDDNFNQNLDRFPVARPVRFNPLPLDRMGVGNRGNAIQRSFAALGGTADPVRYPAFNEYYLNDLPYGNHYGVTMMNPVTLRAGTAFIDDPSEVVVDPSISANFPDDSPFNAVESAGLQLADTDLSNIGFQSSLRELAPWTFRETTRTEDIRRAFTTVSHDLKTHSKRLFGGSASDGGGPYPTVSVNNSRNWEWLDADNDGLLEFPFMNPLGGGFPPVAESALLSKNQPIRFPVAELLYQEEGDSQSLKLMRKLNVNGITEFDRDFNALANKGFLRQRGLMPHSVNIPAAQLTTQFTVPNRNNYMAFVNNRLNMATAPGSTVEQEFIARVDRQKLAHDIYVMLYLFGSKNNAAVTNTFTRSNLMRGLYTLEECREMAQFAVNLVDYMDSDDVITKFEYDVSLDGGWDLDDYPYDIPAVNGWGDTNYSGGTTADISAGGERGVVYGVEEQQLSFNEGQVLFAKEVRQDEMDPSSGKQEEPWTEWDDQLNHHFLFLELQNTSARPVTFSNREWQIVVRPYEWTGGANPDTDAGTLIGDERRLVLDIPTASVSLNPGGNNSVLAIGTVGNENNGAVIYPSQTNPGPARMQITDTIAHDVAPAIGVGSTRYIDLTTETGLYDVYDDPANPTDEQDGTVLPQSAAVPSGCRLLQFSDMDALYEAHRANPGTFSDNHQVEVILRRRLDPNRVTPAASNAAQNEDNPWIVVDRKRLPIRALNIQYGQTTFTASHFDHQLRSESRDQPLFGLYENDNTQFYPRYTLTPGDPHFYSFNSIGFLNRHQNDNSMMPATVPDVPSFTLWHPHANHELSSLTDLFNVPLFGPDRLNDPIAPLAPIDTSTGNGPWRGLTTKLGELVGGGTYGRQAKLAGRDTFGHRVLNPWGPDGDPTPPGASFPTAALTDNNRWYRVLEFLDTGSPIHQSVSPDGTANLNAGAIVFNNVLGKVGGSQTRLYRQPGVINLNTIREPHMLAALMDNPGQLFGAPFGNGVHGFNPLGTNLPTMQDVTTGGTRAGTGSTIPAAYNDDWWRIFAISRDGDDPIVPGRVLPGIPGVSRPFRGLDVATDPISTNQRDHSIERTVLRSIPYEWETAATAMGKENPRARQLFQLGSDTQHNAFIGPALTGGATDDNTLDYAYKYRMLAKVLNNTTLRSNTFFVFLQADYFNAEIAADGAVRVGSKLGNSPGYRGFFIVDRTKAMELIQASDVPDKRNSKSFSFNQNFNWRALLLHRQRLN